MTPSTPAHVLTTDRVDLRALLSAIYGETPAVAQEPAESTPAYSLVPAGHALAMHTDAARDGIVQCWWLLQTYGQTGDVAGVTTERQTLPERLAALLIEHADARGLLVGIGHVTLADYVGTYRENVSAILRAFRRQGLVELGHRRIQIVDYPALAEIADM